MGESRAERKARLKALRQEKDAHEASTDSGGGAAKRKRTEGAGEATAEPVIKFRNYAPSDAGLKEAVMEAAALPDIETAVETTLAQVRDEEASSKLDEGEGGEMDVLNLAPRKIDWDLKRDIAKKLEKLERRTNRSIVEIIRAKHSDAADDAL